MHRRRSMGGVGTGGAARSVLLFAAILAGGCGRCSGGSAAGAADAASDVAASSSADARTKEARHPADLTIRVVGEAPAPGPRFVSDGTRLLLGAGSLLYEAKPDGDLAIVGGAASYAPLYPEGESLIGYGPAFPKIDAVAGDGRGGALLAFSPAAKVYRHDGAKLEALDAKAFASAVPFRGKVLVVPRDRAELAWLDGAKDPLPPLRGLAVQRIARAKGAVVALARSKDGAAHALVLRDEPPDAVPSDTRLETGASPSCGFVRSFDGATYVRCASTTGGKRAARIVRLDGDAWRPAFADAAPEDPDGPMSVDRDGALWVGARASLHVDRCPPKGACAAYDHAPAERDMHGPLPASFRRSTTDAMDPSTERYWETIALGTTEESVKPPHIVDLVARAPDDVWAIVASGLLQYVAHAGPPRPIVQLPSDVDARLVVRNTRPPARWIGHCDHVFLRMAGAKGSAPLDVEAARARFAGIKAALAPPPRRDDDAYYDAPFAWALVTGTLHDERVVGVVVHRTDVAAPVELMERAVEKLSDELARDPVSKPLVTCTLPVPNAELSEPKR